MSNMTCTLLEITEVLRIQSESFVSLEVQQSGIRREYRPPRHSRTTKKKPDQLHRFRASPHGRRSRVIHVQLACLCGSSFLHWMSTGLGISMGYHRLHTHRSYRVPLALEYFFAVCGTLTLEGGPIFWVATHRIHHQKSDQPGDPHSPRDGGWWYTSAGFLLERANIAIPP
jgi:hypothetical protein